MGCAEAVLLCTCDKEPGTPCRPARQQIDMQVLRPSQKVRLVDRRLHQPTGLRRYPICFMETSEVEALETSGVALRYSGGTHGAKWRRREAGTDQTQILSNITMPTSRTHHDICSTC
jgi:hypothetical protein